MWRTLLPCPQLFDGVDTDRSGELDPREAELLIKGLTKMAPSPKSVGARSATAAAAAAPPPPPPPAAAAAATAAAAVHARFGLFVVRCKPGRTHCRLAIPIPAH